MPVLNINTVKQALRAPLPGVTAQDPMAPDSRRNIDRLRLMRPNRREGAVLLLLFPNTDGKLHLVLIRRAEYDGVHSGQIAFPGGGRENGEPLSETALRETQEEVGVSPGRITVLGPLTPLYIPPSNFEVFPFVGCVSARPPFVPDSREVAEILEPPLSLFFDSEIRKRKTIRHATLGLIEIPYYDVYGRDVWGATAMILSEFTGALQAHAPRFMENA